MIMIVMIIIINRLINKCQVSTKMFYVVVIN